MRYALGAFVIALALIGLAFPSGALTITNGDDMDVDISGITADQSHWDVTVVHVGDNEVNALLTGSGGNQVHLTVNLFDTFIIAAIGNDGGFTATTLSDFSVVFSGLNFDAGETLGDVNNSPTLAVDSDGNDVLYPFGTSASISGIGPSGFTLNFFDFNLPTTSIESVSVSMGLIASSEQPPLPVPEPASALLLGLGAGAALLRRKLRFG